MSGIIAWMIFGGLALIAVITAAAMQLTMSMYRAGLALMASFVALAGLFLLLDADLPFAIQIMMNVGGMMIMMLFMVMLMMDPGGEMMWGMKRDMGMRGPGAFAMHMPWRRPPADPGDAPGEHQHAGQHAGGGMDQQRDEQTQPPDHELASHAMPAPSAHEHGHGGANEGEGQQAGEQARQHYQTMVDMAMTTRQLPLALLLGALAAAVLIALVVLTPWPLAHASPTQDASAAVGSLLLSRYMVGFEGAAFLIVGGIAGAVILGRREAQPPQRTSQQSEHGAAGNRQAHDPHDTAHEGGHP